jgi:peptidoglycan/xylan/chitin deacetylase (PgdA/CDA1 family)
MVLDAWRSEFDAVYDLGVGYFMVTMHPECIGRASRMNLLKQLIDHICEKSGTVFGRCDEYVEYISRLPQKSDPGKES